MLKYILLGFFVNLTTSFDDALTHIPIIAAVTRTRKGKFVFGAGILMAIVVAIFLSLFFSSFLRSLPYYNIVAACLIFFLAAAIQFEWFVHLPRAKAEKEILKLEKKPIYSFPKIFLIGFIAALATVLDDIVAYSSLFINKEVLFVYPAIGILLAALFEIFIVLKFSKALNRWKYKKELAVFGLVALGVLLVFGVI